MRASLLQRLIFPKFECILYLPYVGVIDGVVRHPGAEDEEDTVRRDRHLVAALYRRRIPDQRRNNRTSPTPYAVGPRCQPGAVAPTILRPVPRRTRAPADVSYDPLLDTALAPMWRARVTGGGRSLPPYATRYVASLLMHFCQQLVCPDGIKYILHK